MNWSLDILWGTDATRIQQVVRCCLAWIFHFHSTVIIGISPRTVISRSSLSNNQGWPSSPQCTSWQLQWCETSRGQIGGVLLARTVTPKFLLGLLENLIHPILYKWSPLLSMSSNVIQIHLRVTVVMWRV